MTDHSARIAEMRKESTNKKCFDCGEKGVNYVIINIGIFVCAACSGIHREIGNRAKGMGMSVFTDKDMEMLEKWGNKKASEYWMAEYNRKLSPMPDKKDTVKMKDFFK